MSRSTSPSAAAFVLHDVTFHWPDGTPCLERIDLTVPRGRSGLVGDNGSGKSTLVKLLAGTLTPTSGVVTRPAHVGLLPQDLALQRATPVTEHLGIAAYRRALVAVEAGDTDPEKIALVADLWDVEDRLAAAPRWPPCCSPSRRPSCCSSTSRRTAWTSARTKRWSPRLRGSQGPWWWSVTTIPSWSTSGCSARCSSVSRRSATRRAGRQERAAPR